MENEFIPYEQALALKELGFDEPCIAYYYDNEILYAVGVSRNIFQTLKNKKDKYPMVPTFSQAFRFFREKHQLHPEIVVQLGFAHWNAHILPSGEWLQRPTPTGFETYEEVELACLKKLIEIVKTK